MVRLMHIYWDSQTGRMDATSRAIRPIVTINLNESGYTMNSEVGTDGKMKITLS